MKTRLFLLILIIATLSTFVESFLAGVPSSADDRPSFGFTGRIIAAKQNFIVINGKQYNQKAYYAYYTIDPTSSLITLSASGSTYSTG